jgi:GntR family transcriptional regulator/MocR family aminotransferase
LNFSALRGDNIAVEITAQLRHMLDSGVLCAGDKLPSSRTLAADLGVARGTVVAALDTLIAEGFLIARRGSGTFVSRACNGTSPRTVSRTKPPPRIKTVLPDIDAAFAGALNFQACRPSLEAFPQSAWRRATAHAASRLPRSDYGDPQGELELRIAIAAYLCRARGLDVNADEIIVTNGAIQAMHVVSNLYLAKGSGAAFEDPGYPLARQAIAMTGARIHAIGVDQDGMRVADLPADGGDLRIVYVTPSHQFPTGQRLSLSRRQDLLDWACRNDVLILEDDYDGEFRYDIAPLPPMASMCVSGLVAYFGTFSKTMFPSLRLGFAAGEKFLIRDMAAYRAVTDYQTNSLAQLALATFIENGEFEKHVHRMRRLYAKKRQCLRSAIDDSRLDGVLTGTDSGINALIRLNTDIPASNIANRARLKGIYVTPIARYNLTATFPDNALIFGYGAVSEQQIVAGIDKLAAIIRNAS